MTYNFNFGVVADNWSFLLSGIGVTLGITFVAVILALILGLVLGTMRLATVPWLRLPAIGFIEVFRNTPALVQLIWVYYCLPIVTGLDLSAGVSCGIALTLYGAAYNAEIFRAGINSVPVGQVQAGRALGLNWLSSMRYIILPQATTTMIPPFVNEAVTLLKFSSLVSIFGVGDLTYKAQSLASTTFRPIEIFTALAGIYLVICGALVVAATYLERRYRRGLGHS